MPDRHVPPEACANLDEIRAGMDAIDREIISLIGRRVAYMPRGSTAM